MFLPESLCDMLCVILGLGKYFCLQTSLVFELALIGLFMFNNLAVKNKLKTCF